LRISVERLNPPILRNFPRVRNIQQLGRTTKQRNRICIVICGFGVPVDPADNIRTQARQIAGPFPAVCGHGAEGKREPENARGDGDLGIYGQRMRQGEGSHGGLHRRYPRTFSRRLDLSTQIFRGTFRAGVLCRGGRRRLEQAVSRYMDTQ